MDELIRTKSWAATALGSIDTWPVSLQASLGICLALPGPACIAWGTQRAQIFNDAYSQLAFIQPSTALGIDFAHSWSDAWQKMQACFERAARGEAVLLEGQHVSFAREEGSEEALMTLSFAPIHDGSGGIGGVMITLLEAGSAQLREQLARTRADLMEYGYIISHDFRSSLRTLEQLAATIVADHAAQLPQAAIGLLNYIVSGATKLSVRAESISRVDALMREPLRRERIDVSALTAVIIEELRSATRGRQIETIVGELPPVDADRESLRLVLSSLLSNAFKFTRNVEHARVEVTGRRQGHHNVYSIKDNGVGFDAQYAQRLFGFFQRMHTQAEFEGVGVGLALAKRLVERHDGAIWAEAQKDRGAEFRFSLPAYPP
jgi:signal transduction histidine kinase